MTHAADISAETCTIVTFGSGPSDVARDHPTPRVLDSRRFGRMEVAEDQVLTVPAGLLGFEEYVEYCLLAPEALYPLMFLVVCDNPEVTFPVLPARMCLAEYAPALPQESLEAIGAHAGEPVEILAICALAQDRRGRSRRK